MRMLQEENIWIVGTAGEADHTLYQSKMTGRLALVMGAEGEGMRRLTREHCDGRKRFFPERFCGDRDLLI